jgi:DNA-binding SARP family transcriptional activator
VRLLSYTSTQKVTCRICSNLRSYGKSTLWGTELRPHLGPILRYAIKIVNLCVGATMSRITIQLFGQFCVRRNEQVVGGFEAHKVQELFCYLMLHRHHSLSRESLASLLWPECTTAQSKKKLRQALWHLQSAMGSQSETVHDRVLLVEPERVQINAEADLWLDVAVFEKTYEFVQSLAGQELDAQKVQALQNAVQLYQGPLLEGCYADWCLYPREHFQNMYLVMLEKLMNYCEAHQDYDAGILYGMRILSCDKARERTHRRLMRLYYLNGDRAAALRQYEQCATILDKELGVKPSKRTITLYKQILAEQLVEPERTLTPTEVQPAPELSTPQLIESLSSLIQLQEFLANLQNQVQDNIQKVEQALNNADLSNRNR